VSAMHDSIVDVKLGLLGTEIETALIASPG